MHKGPTACVLQTLARSRNAFRESQIHTEQWCLSPASETLPRTSSPLKIVPESGTEDIATICTNAILFYEQVLFHSISGHGSLRSFRYNDWTWGWWMFPQFLIKMKYHIPEFWVTSSSSWCFYERVQGLFNRRWILRRIARRAEQFHLAEMLQQHHPSFSSNWGTLVRKNVGCVRDPPVWAYIVCITYRQDPGCEQSFSDVRHRNQLTPFLEPSPFRLDNELRAWAEEYPYHKHFHPSPFPTFPN